MTTPTCPNCGAKFQHDPITLTCRQCGLPDEVLARGRRALQKWQKATGQPVSRGGAVQARKRAHGRAQTTPAKRTVKRVKGVKA